MTLLVGIKCVDGIVIGADGAATLGTMGQRTIQQPYKKITIIDGKIITASTGHVGLGQRWVELCTELHKSTKDNPFHMPAPRGMVAIRMPWFNNHLQMEQTASHAAGRVVGDSARNTAICCNLLAARFNSQPELIEYDPQGAPEMKTAEMPFAAMGSGQNAADPFLAFLRKTFWPTTPPTLEEGVFATVWALRHTIDHCPGGVDDPIQVATLAKRGGNWSAEFVPDDQVKTHESAVEDARNSLREWRAKQQGKAVAEPPPAPIPAPPGQK